MRKVCLTFALILLLFFQVNLINVGAKSTDYDWWNTDWLYRRAVDITEKSGCDLTYFPVTLTFEHNGHVLSNGNDVRVVSDGKEVPSYVSSLNNTHCIVQFEISISALTKKTVYIYYGNNDASASNYPKVPLQISEGAKKGYAIIDNSVYIGWDQTGMYGSNQIGDKEVFWVDYRIDFNGDKNLTNDKDLITDWGYRHGAIGRFFVDYGSWNIKTIGLGNYIGYIQTPIYVNINFANATLTVFKNNTWVKTRQADHLRMGGDSWNYANYENSSEVNALTYDINHYSSDSVWMAFRNSNTGLVFAGIGLGTAYKGWLYSEPHSDWCRFITFDSPGYDYSYDKTKTNYPFAPYDQPVNAEIYWCADNSNGYSRVERWAKILHNKPLILIGNEETIRYIRYIRIDQAYTSGNKVKVGSIQTIGFHVEWGSNGSAVTGGKIYVNGTQYFTNNTGWIVFDSSLSTVGKRSWIVTSVDCNGVTEFLSSVSSPTIIWDSLKIGELSVNASIPASIQVVFSVKYEYDNSPVNDAIATVNDIKAENTGNGRYKVSLSSLMPILSISINVERGDFEPLTTVITSYSFGNIAVESISVIILGVIVVRIKSRKQRMNLKQLEKMLTEQGKIDVTLASNLIGVDVTETNRLLSELIKRKEIQGISIPNGFITNSHLINYVNKSGKVDFEKMTIDLGFSVGVARDTVHKLFDQKKIQGTFTSDDRSFVTEERLMEEVKKDLE